METAFLDFLVGGGTSNSVTKTKLRQTNAISFRVLFGLAHGKVSTARSIEQDKISFSGELKFWWIATVGRELQATACRVEPRSTIQERLRGRSLAARRSKIGPAGRDFEPHR